MASSKESNDLITGQVIGEFNLNYIQDENGTLQPQLVPIHAGDISIEELLNTTPTLNNPQISSDDIAASPASEALDDIDDILKSENQAEQASVNAAKMLQKLNGFGSSVEMYPKPEPVSYDHVRIVITEQPAKNKLRFRYFKIC